MSGLSDDVSRPGNDAGDPGNVIHQPGNNATGAGNKVSEPGIFVSGIGKILSESENTLRLPENPVQLKELSQNTLPASSYTCSRPENLREYVDNAN